MPPRLARLFHRRIDHDTTGHGHHPDRSDANCEQVAIRHDDCRSRNLPAVSAQRNRDIFAIVQVVGARRQKDRESTFGANGESAAVNSEQPIAMSKKQRAS